MQPVEVRFREVQRFRQWWLALLLALSAVVPGLLLFGHLRTEVREDGLHVQYFPFHPSARRIAFEELESAEARTYDPIREYGGWGLRGASRDAALNVSGNRGVQLVFRDGRRLLIGSQRAEELETAIRAGRRGEPGAAFVEVQYLGAGWMLLVGLLPLAAAALVLGASLRTEVRADGLYVRFAPFHRRERRLGWEEIASAEARTYRPLLEYGGWGLRGWKANRAFNVSGNRGVQLVLKNGDRLLLGSQRAEELERAIAAARAEWPGG
jgi:hypothetical protein